MAPLKTEAIILKRSDFRETSVILSLYTRHLGKIRGILKGVRTEKSRVSPLTFAQGSHILTFIYVKRFSELNLISSPSLIEYYEIEEKDNLKTWYLSLNLVNLFAPEKEQDESIFDLLQKTGNLLVSSKTPKILFLIFKLKLIKILGYGIELSKCVSCGSEEKTLLFSGKMGGLLCGKCKNKDSYSLNISDTVVNIMRQLERINIEKSGIIKSIPIGILKKINFYCNITLNYHADIDKMWWTNEKSFL